ncbi:MAG TPA: hypothetical protein VHU84_02195 [Lacipirellulaceae bacterium]|jgi:hypothetical protein|nr:hypothetical protein [Lacipirellulaceae bacterium]
MANPPSRDALRAELEARGLPPAYIERLLGELDDHYNDLLEERSSSMGAARKLDFEANDLQERLGEPTQLAIFAAEQYRARSFWGRHPIVTFVLGPLPLLLISWIITGCAVVWTAEGITYIGEHWFGVEQDKIVYADHLWAQAGVMSFCIWIIVAFPPILVAAVMCRTARRNAVKWRWPIIACMLISSVAGFLAVSYRLALQPNEGQITLGIDWESSFRWFLLNYVSKFATAMVIGLLLVKRSQQKLKLAT